MYGSDKAGFAYPGMDDQGSTSSWYVLSALGFYTVNPARPEYIIGSPLFDVAPRSILAGEKISWWSPKSIPPKISISNPPN